MLAVIFGYVELALLRADAPPLPRDDLAEIHTAASRSAQVTQQLLTFARKQIVSPQVPDVNATVAHSLSMLRWLIGEQVQCIWAPAGDLWPVCTADGVHQLRRRVRLCLTTVRWRSRYL